MNTDKRRVIREIRSDNSRRSIMSKDMRRNEDENAGGGATAPLTPTHSLYSSSNPI